MPSGERRSAEADSLEGQSVASELALAQIPVVQASAVRLAAIPAAARSQELAGVVACLLVLASGLGLLLLWRQVWSGGWPRRRRSRGGRGLDLDGMLPPSGFRPRTPHERLHDPVYLQRILEAELSSSRSRHPSDSHP